MVPPEFSLVPPKPVASVGEEPSVLEYAAFEHRFDVRRERAVLSQETGGVVDGDGPGTSGGNGERGGGQTNEFPGTDPTSLESVVRRIKSEPDDGNIEKYVRLGYSRKSVIYALTLWGDDEGKVIDFMEGFSRGIEMGIEPTVLAGALAVENNDVERAVASVM
ncbi:hypothetical protein N9F40_01545 [bacterium]|nr:hypothetical protein [bacterium]